MTNRLSWLASLVLVLCSAGGVQAQSKELLADPIRTDAGYISGTTIGTLDDAVRVYRGIPYAAPPLAGLRWKAPQPVAPWSGIRETTQFTKMAIQGSNVVNEMLGLESAEDCLYLHVVTPAKHRADKLPVMVWFHGGGLTIGTSSDALFNSYRLPAHGVITVSVNHRLGVMGLLAHPQLTAQDGNSGNYLVLDMIAALEWVQKNIRAFGGDPDNVTIFGQSGGGMKVSTLIASPLAKGLFNKAIVQSGAPFPGGGVARADLEANGRQLFAALGVSSLEEARALAPEVIVTKDNELQSSKAYAGWATAIDQVVLKGSPLDVIVAGEGNPVDLITGANAGELEQFSGMLGTYVQMLTGVRSTGHKTYAYMFDQVPANWRQLGGGAVHGMELQYLFGDYDGTISAANWGLMQMMLGRAIPAITNLPPSLGEADQRASTLMMSMWTNFAKTGRPYAEHAPAWPQWSAETDRYLSITDSPEVMPGFSAVQKQPLSSSAP
jgi:para-nitrobenzyl esterase